MRKRKPILICAQPLIQYYAWQLEVMLHNFRQVGLLDHKVHILVGYNRTQDNLGKLWDTFKRIESRYEFCEFFFYEDSRQQPIYYISSIRPNLLWQHFEKHPTLSNEVFFYHDCDIVFTKYPDFFEKYMEDDENWYVSNTISYIGHRYIKSKGDAVTEMMLSQFGISEQFIQDREEQSGGAQYIMKGVDWRFFKKMQFDCELLFKNVTELNKSLKKVDDTYHELQIWCSDMWAILWNAWMRGFKTNIIPELDFAWATDDISRWDEKYIFHNAGVTSSMKQTLFYKGDYMNNTPYNVLGDTYDTNRASYKYFEIVKEVSKQTAI